MRCWKTDEKPADFVPDRDKAARETRGFFLACLTNEPKKFQPRNALQRFGATGKKGIPTRVAVQMGR